MPGPRPPAPGPRYRYPAMMRAMTRARLFLLAAVLSLAAGAAALGRSTRGDGDAEFAASSWHQLQGPGVHVQQDRRWRVSRRRHGQPRGDVERCRHRGRHRRTRCRFARLAWRRVGVARGAEGDHFQAHSIRRQQPLSLRPFARQSGLRTRGADHRPRVRARADSRGQVAGLTRARVFRRGRAEHDQDPRGPAGGGERRQGTRDPRDAARHPAESPRGHQRRQADATQRHADADDDALPRVAGDSHRASGTRPHRRRRRRLSAKGTNSGDR